MLRVFIGETRATLPGREESHGYFLHREATGTFLSSASEKTSKVVQTETSIPRLEISDAMQRVDLRRANLPLSPPLLRDN